MNEDIELSIGNDVTMKAASAASLGRIDHYELLKELGGGGFGTVYLARNTVAGIDVAVKGLPPLVRNNKEELENIRSNFALVQRLHHPNIAAALDLHPVREAKYEDKATAEKLRVFEGDTMMVMQYAPGVTLSQWRKQFPDRKVPLPLAILIVRQVAAALDEAHKQKVIHRDVKPANVMVESISEDQVVARILDFGLAAEIRSSMGRISMEVRDTSGTRPYMAPEQWAGRKQGPATDQYALAVLFCELVTGEVPFSSVFECGDPAVMMTAVCNRPVELPDDCPCVGALQKALSKDPAERYETCVSFCEALSSGGTGFGRVGTKGRRRLLTGLLIASVLICSIVVGSCVYQNNRKSRAEAIALQAAKEKETAEKLAAAAQAKKDAEERAQKIEAEKKALEEKTRKEAEERIAQEKKRAEELAAKVEAEGKAKKEAEQELARLQQKQNKANKSGDKLKAEQVRRQKELTEMLALRTKIAVRRNAIAAFGEQVEPYRKDTDGFVEHLAKIDQNLKNVKELADPNSKDEAETVLAKATEAQDAIAVELEWLRVNRADRDKAKAIEARIESDVMPRIKSFRADDVAMATYAEGKQLRESGNAALLKGDFATAYKDMVNAEKKLDEAIIEARRWHVTTTLSSANEYRTASQWEQCHAEAKKVLQWDSTNATAIALCKECEERLAPMLNIITKIDGRVVEGATVNYGGRTLVTPAKIKLSDEESLPTISVSMVSNEKKLRGFIAGMNVDWRGVKEVVVDLEECVDTQAKTEVEFGDNEVGQSSPAQGTQSSQSRTSRVEHFGFFSQTSNKTPSEDKDSEEGFGQTGDGFGQTEKKEEGFFSSLWRGLSEPPKPGCKWRRSSGKMCGAPTVGESEYCGLHKCKFCNEPYLKNGRCEEHQHYR